jgi:ribonuclease P protein component
MGASSFPRAARLLRPADFAELRGRGQRISVRHFHAEWRPTDAATARMGAAVSRRVSKRAVIRNRIKRQLRESFRHVRHQLPAIDVLVVARSSAAEQTPATLRIDLQTLWSKLLPLKRNDSNGTMRADP